MEDVLFQKQGGKGAEGFDILIAIRRSCSAMNLRLYLSSVGHGFKKYLPSSSSPVDWKTLMTSWIVRLAQLPRHDGADQVRVVVEVVLGAVGEHGLDVGVAPRP
jgi:hypothetical protein